MKKQFLLGLFYMLGLNLLIKPFYIFGIDRLLQLEVNKTSGEGTYGLYTVFFTWSYLYYIVLDLGFADYNKRQTAKDSSYAPHHFASFLISKLFLGVVYFIILALSIWIAGYETEVFTLVIPLGFIQLFISFIFFFRSVIAGLLLFKLDSFFQVMDRLLMILFGGILLFTNLFGQVSIYHFVYAQLLAYGLTAICSGVVALRHTKNLGTISWQYNPKQIIEIAREALPLAVLVLIMTVYNRLDTIMIERLLPDGKLEVDVYARGYRLLDSVQAFTYIFGALLLPLYAKQIQEKESVSPLVELGLRSVLSIAIPLVIGTFFYRSELMETLYYLAPNSYDSQVLAALIATFIPIGMVYILGSLITANNNLILLNVISLVGVIANFILNYYLIHSHKALGATYATLITQSLVALTYLIACYRIFNLEIGKTFYLPLLYFIVGVFAIFWLMHHFTQANLMGYVLGGALCIPYAVLVKFFLKSDIHILASSRGSEK